MDNICYAMNSVKKFAYSNARKCFSQFMNYNLGTIHYHLTLQMRCNLDIIALEHLTKLFNNKCRKIIKYLTFFICYIA